MIKLARYFGFAALAGGALLAAGFLAYVYAIERDAPANLGRADGIVALTGGKHRIAEAIDLLAEGRAGRLLITGVNRRTSRRALRRLLPHRSGYFDCCIDIGYQALNTIGNADETRAWVRGRGFKRLIVVTSSYHMPRSLAELRRALPGVELIAYPVLPEHVRVNAWWSHPGTARLLVKEYLKLVSALARLGAARMFGYTSGESGTYADPSRLATEF